MSFSRPSLHPPVVSDSDHLAAVESEFSSLHARQMLTGRLAASTLDSVQIHLTSVSANGNFDSKIAIRFRNAASSVDMLLDSGSSVLVVPYWESIAALQDWQSNYTILAEMTEPWGCPAYVVVGPIDIPTVSGDIFTLPNCVFYACVANNAQNQRTANFGAGCLTPWWASSFNVVPGIGAMMAPLAYNVSYPFAEIKFAAAAQLLTAASTPKVAAGSSLTLNKTRPSGYRLFNIVSGTPWMSLRPRGLSIGGVGTVWPSALPAIAMIATGGGPVFLSDPNADVCDRPWPDRVQNPVWTSSSVDCQSTRNPITVTLGDDVGSALMSYTIDPSLLPPSARGLSLVMCRNCQYMWGQQGMNVGGISLLVNDLLIDYQNFQIGLKSR